MNFFLVFLFWFVVVGLPVSAIVYLIACFTSVDEGTSKQVVRFGGFLKSLLKKEGHDLDENWDLKKLGPGEHSRYPKWMGGIRWVGLLKPLGIDKIYVTTMKFVKAMPRGEAGNPEKKYEEREDKGIDFLLTGTQYQYALIVKDAEDSNGLWLNAQMTMTAQIINPYKALFLVRDWFDALVSRVLPRVREYISEHTYEELINDPAVQLDKDVFKMLNKEEPFNPDNPDDYDYRSIVKILKDEYGVHLVALETVDINPPKEHRETTVAEWQEERLAKAEEKKQQIRARAFAYQTTGAEMEMLSRATGIPVEELQQGLSQSLTEAWEEDPVHGMEKWLEEHPKYWSIIEKNLLGVRPILFGNADGSAMDPLTAALASLISLAKGAAPGGSPPANPAGFAGGPGGGQQSASGGNSGDKKIGNMTDKEFNEWVDNNKTKRKRRDN